MLSTDFSKCLSPPDGKFYKTSFQIDTSSRTFMPWRSSIKLPLFANSSVGTLYVLLYTSYDLNWRELISAQGMVIGASAAAGRSIK